jgi:hypothetical protein
VFRLVCGASCWDSRVFPLCHSPGITGRLLLNSTALTLEKADGRSPSMELQIPAASMIDRPKEMEDRW